MKRTLAVLLLVGCGGSAPKPAPPVAADPTEPAPVPPGKPVENVSLADVGLEAASLNRAADPCTDFFEFACGGWLAKTEIPGDQKQWGRFHEIHQRNERVLREILEGAAKDAGADPVLGKLGAHYAACMDEPAIEKAGTRPLAPLLGAIRKVKDTPSLGPAIAALHAGGVPVLFRTGPAQDVKDATKVIADIDQAGLGMPSRDHYLAGDDKAKELRRSYVAHVERTLRLAGRSAAEARRGAADVLLLETEMARAMLSPVEQRDPVATYNRIDRVGLVREAPTLGWDTYFKVIGRPDLQDISVHSIAYTRAMDALLTRHPAPRWRAYLTYHVVAAHAAHLPRRFVDEAFAFERELYGVKEQRPRWKRCVAAADTALGELLAQPFVARAFPGESKEAAEALVREIMKAFEGALPAVTWLDEPTRGKAREKLRKMDLLIGYPEAWRTYPFEIDRAGHLRNMLAARRHEVTRELAKIGKPVDRGEFQLSPQTVNAYYDPSRNQMVFLAGILQTPFFDVKASQAVNLGGLGMIAGHELTHGFDDQGGQFDAAGNLSGWWSDEITQRFKERTACVAGVYSQYEPLPGVKLNGELTNGENIADVGGLKNAFRAYRRMRAEAPKQQLADGFTEDQQFFLAHAQAWCEETSPEYARVLVSVDPHSPSRFRVNGPLAQIPQFAEAFQCKAGSKMRAESICDVW
jgi:putative endopeptidase